MFFGGGRCILNLVLLSRPSSLALCVGRLLVDASLLNQGEILSTIIHYFWNTSENRLRAGWRLVLQLALNIGGTIVFIAFVVPYTALNYWPRLAREAVGYPILLLITLFSVWFAGRFLDRRLWRDFGLVLSQRAWWEDFGMGLVVGTGLVVLLIFTAKALGIIQLKLTLTSGIEGLSFPVAVLLSIIGFGAVGFFEELARAYHIRNLFEAFSGTRFRLLGAALLATGGAALVSVIMHSGGMPLFILYVFVSTSIQGLFYLFTGRVALITGYHIAWDITLATIFGIEALTQTEHTGLFTSQLTGMMQMSETGLIINDYFPLALMGLAVIVFQGLAWLALLGWVHWRAGGVHVRAEMAQPTLLR
jgi:membrane protease YdiL (CAAX protease family)